MGKIFRAAGAGLLAAWLLLSACAQADEAWTQFDINAQPMGAALNEFARQADVTLIFSYDAVHGARSQAIFGQFTVDEGLARLLLGTQLSFTKSNDGTYMVCRAAECAAHAIDPRSHPQSTRSTKQ